MYDLRDRLRSRGSNLLIRFGKLEKVVGDVLTALEANGDKVKTVLLNQEVSGPWERHPPRLIALDVTRKCTCGSQDCVLSIVLLGRVAAGTSHHKGGCVGRRKDGTSRYITAEYVPTV